MSVDDIVFARRLGYVIKLLGIVERSEDSKDASVALHVHPAMVSLTHPLASVRGSFNAVFIEGEAVGELMLYGRGAGGLPTASAVMGDLIDAARAVGTFDTFDDSGGRMNEPSKSGGGTGGTFDTADDGLTDGTALDGEARGGARSSLRPLPIRPIEELRTAYYLALEVEDRPGVLAAVASVFGAHEISILSMEQEGLGAEARLIFITHVAREKDMRSTIASLRELDAVRRVGSVIRVITEDQ